MAPKLSCAAKLERAATHLQELKSKAGDWSRQQIKLHPCECIPHPEQAGYFLVKISANAPPLEEFSPILGDCIQNLRSSLEHLVYGLALKHSGSLSESEARDCQFPIIGDDSKKGLPGAGATIWRDSAVPRWISKVSPQAQAIIEGLQPYKLGALYKTHPLWILGELSNADKHRFIHIVNWRNAVFGFVVARGAEPHEMWGTIEVYEPTLIDSDTVIAKIPDWIVNISERDEHMKVKFDAGIIVAFADGDLRGKEVVGIVGSIYHYVANTAFSQLLPLL